MSRYIFQDIAVDGKGNRVTAATVNIYEAGGLTAANVYVASSGGSSVNSVTADSTDGSFSFYVDEGDYVNSQKFKIEITKTDYISFTIDDVKIFPFTSLELELKNVTGKYLGDLFDGGYDVPIKPQYIFGGGTNTNGHTVPNSVDDTFALIAATQTLTNKTLTSPVINTPTGDVVTITGIQTLTNKTLTTPTIASLVNATHDHSNAANGGTISTGTVLQVVNVMDGAVATGTTVIPLDDTIPQNTEGDEYMTLAITPANTNNILIIDVVWNGASTTSGEFIAALFQDSTADALACGISPDIGANRLLQVIFKYKMTAGTTSATTFKVRAGLEAAGTTTFNGFSSARKFGGVMASSITITEYEV